jgi:hypothetical protein
MQKMRCQKTLEMHSVNVDQTYLQNASNPAKCQKLKNEKGV